MSTATPQPAPAAPAPPRDTRREIIIVSHSGLFYWWPVWAVGFLMALITIFGGDRMATIPAKSEEIKKAKSIVVTKEDGRIETFENRSALVAPEHTDLTATQLHVSHSKNLGVIFCMVLLIVIGITNVPLRGLWSVIVIVFVVAMTIILALLPGNWLERLLEYFFILDVRINAAGYFMISAVLFVLWLLIFLLFDQQIYMIFSPGQMRVKLEIGDAETAYDTTGITIQKQRSDLFRHWILGLGSGDLIVHVPRAIGEHGRDIQMPNVLFLGRKVREIELLLRQRQVVSGPSA
jgi:hypothetical protein